MTTPGPSPRRSRLLQLALPLTVSGAAALWFIEDVDWQALSAALAGLRLPWVGLAALLLLGEFGLRALRWAALLRPLGAGARPVDLFAAQLIGAAANTLLPLRAGELAKPLVASARSGHPLSSVVATAVLERVFDLFGLCSLLVVMAWSLPEAPGEEQELVVNLKRYGGLAGIAALTGLSAGIGLSGAPGRVEGLLRPVLAALPRPLAERGERALHGFLAGLGSSRDPAALARAGALSVTLWLNGALAIWALFQAFGNGLPFGAACFTAVAIALTVALPQAPGFIGVFHVAMEKTMALWGQPPAEAKAFAVVFWAVSFVPVTTLGVLAMWREGLALRGLLARRAAAGDEGPPTPAEGR
jgi:uncharacterized membrane protein YbhN (UPF0104 family)